jgi:hypothetical protein
MRFSIKLVVVCCVLCFHLAYGKTLTGKQYTWLIEKNEQGSLMTLDVPFKMQKRNGYLTVIVSKRKGEARPDVITIMVPQPVKKENGMYVMFARAQQKNGKNLIVRDTNMTANTSFSNCNSEFCSVQINKGYLTGRSRQQTYDVLQNLLSYDEMTFLFFDKKNNIRVDVPLASFKKQYKELP